jgi:phosphoribosylanthranilate isomerase
VTGRRVRVKICGLTRAEDARAAAHAGADYLGVILTAGFGRSVSVREAARVLDGVGPTRVAVVVDEGPDEVARAARAIEAGVVQLHGSEDRTMICALRDLGDWTIWKAVRARSTEDIRRAVEGLSDVVDGFVVEGWREGVIGGGGVRLPVGGRAARAVIPNERTFVLAGGLAPENVREAVARFSPEVVDVSSGVECAPGVKDPILVQAFVHAATGAIVGSTKTADSSD